MTIKAIALAHRPPAAAVHQPSGSGRVFAFIRFGRLIRRVLAGIFGLGVAATASAAVTDIGGNLPSALDESWA